jgi:medium-chain acyl-[acyl-carrier-protein] hydrolase
MEPLVDALAQEMAPLLAIPFMLFGHSMGALVAFELAHCLRAHSRGEPVALVVSAYPGPRAERTRAMPLHLLSDAALVEELRRFGGTPADVLESSDLLELCLPVVRADFEVCETYAPRAAPPLTCPIIALAGKEDTTVTDEHLQAWRQESNGPFEMRRLPGQHFYLTTRRDALIPVLVSRAQALAAAVSTS